MADLRIPNMYFMRVPADFDFRPPPPSGFGGAPLPVRILEKEEAGVGILDAAGPIRRSGKAGRSKGMASAAVTAPAAPDSALELTR